MRLPGLTSREVLLVSVAALVAALVTRWLS